jgi:DNA-directed RNA polymerase subunit H (RpoH/RPB5)
MSTQVGSTIESKIYKSRNILLKQLEKRGFDVSNYAEFSVNEVNIMMQNSQCDMLVENPAGHKVYVKYHIDKALRPSYIYDVVDELFNIENILNKSTDQIIYITKSDPNDTLIKLLNQLYHTDNVFISVYNIKRLQFNILEHTLVPEHVILTTEETKELFQKFNITESHELPEISRFDPVAVAIGLRPGQVCSINRKSKTAVNSYYYRYCS